MEEKNVCGECEYAELQCPPVIKCTKHNDHRYLDSEACEYFKGVEEEES